MERVLIVDDEAIQREILGHVLTRSGYSVAVASSGREALEKLFEKGVRCVVTDVHMPGMSGLDLGRKIRLLGSRLPVVLMSGTPAEDLEDLMGPDQLFLKKPYFIEEVRRVLSQAMELSTLVERRRAPRVPVDFTFSLAFRGRDPLPKGAVLNVSRAGVLVELPPQEDPGERVSLNLLSERDPVFLENLERVRHAEGPNTRRIGFRIDNLSPETGGRLQGILRERLLLS